MHSISTWLYTGSLLGIPRVGWAIVTALVLLDVLLAHSKNPRIMHLTSAVALLVGNVVKGLGIASIPVFGAGIMAVLNALIGPVGAEPTPVLTPPAAPEPPKAA